MTRSVAVVTGAAHRIGRDIARALAIDGYAVAIHCLSSQDEARQFALTIRSEGGEAEVFVADLADWEQTERLIPEVVARLRPPSLLVNCAATFLPDTPHAFNSRSWRKQFEVNLDAPLILSKAFAAALPPREEGAIVNVVDQRVLRLTPQHFSYTLTKSALWTATQTLAQAFAPRIRVNAVGPGPTYASSLQGDVGLGKEVSGVPLATRVRGEDVARAVVYLAHARAVTGQLICVDAGQHLAWRTPDIVE